MNLGAGRSAKQLATDVMHSCALLDDDTVTCWGHGDEHGSLLPQASKDRPLPTVSRRSAPIPALHLPE